MTCSVSLSFLLWKWGERKDRRPGSGEPVLRAAAVVTQPASCRVLIPGKGRPAGRRAGGRWCVAKESPLRLLRKPLLPLFCLLKADLQGLEEGWGGKMGFASVRWVEPCVLRGMCCWRASDSRELMGFRSGVSGRVLFSFLTFYWFSSLHTNHKRAS